MLLLVHMPQPSVLPALALLAVALGVAGYRRLRRRRP